MSPAVREQHCPFTWGLTQGPVNPNGERLQHSTCEPQARPRPRPPHSPLGLRVTVLRLATRPRSHCPLHCQGGEGSEARPLCATPRPSPPTVQDTIPHTTTAARQGQLRPCTNSPCRTYPGAACLCLSTRDSWSARMFEGTGALEEKKARSVEATWGKVRM